MIAVGIVFALVIVPAGAIALFLSGLASTFDGQVDVLAKSDVFPNEKGRPAASSAGALNILVLASDSRGEVASVDAKETATGQRSDVMMLVHVEAERKRMQVMSIMRDSWVDVPGHGKAKINAALSWGGTALVVQTVEQLLDTRIDHVALIGFEGFEQMTDALGGVTVNVPAPFADGGYTFAEGRTEMDGKQALVFVRQRYAFADGDYQRVRNQQAFIRSLADRAISAGTLTNPAKLSEFVAAIARNLSVDPGFTAQRMVDIGLSLRDLRPSAVEYFTVPTTGTGMEGDESVIYLDALAVPALSTALRNDQVSEFLANRA
ncbi:LCP family protein [Leucobacter iarius]|uniref:LCP family protein n=1 Tax=Leucobacter iarius TaxID=333963 RepID=A0ABN2LUE0_9MICO